MPARWLLSLIACLTLAWGRPAAADATPPAEPTCTVRATGHAVGTFDTRPLAEAFAAEGTTMYAEVAARLGAPSCPPVEVDLVPSMADAAELSPPWSLPPWAAGAAAPQTRRIVVGVVAQEEPQDRLRVLRHELAHVVTTIAAGDRAVPRWFDEGVARVIANEHGGADLTLLARARLTDRLLPLASLETGFPWRSDLASLAYAEAARAVNLIEERGGSDAPARVLAGIRAGATFDDALAAVVGRRVWQLDGDIERSLPMWRALAVVGLETDLAYALAALLTLWAGVRARRQLDARLAAMPPEARPDPLAVWVQAGLPVDRRTHVHRWTVRARRTPG